MKRERLNHLLQRTVSFAGKGEQKRGMRRHSRRALLQVELLEGRRLLAADFGAGLQPIDFEQGLCRPVARATAVPNENGVSEESLSVKGEAETVGDGGAVAEEPAGDADVIVTTLGADADETREPVFPDGLGYEDPVIRAAIMNVTTTGSTEPIFPTGSFKTSSGSDDLGLLTADSSSLIGLDRFRSDPRLAGIDGSGFSAVILDTGIDVDHPFFGPDNNGDGVSDRIVFQFDFANGDDDATDFNDHGSNVTSIVASSDPVHTGMAPGADIINLKVFTDAGGGNFGFLEDALQWVVANAATYNITSVNMSLGNTTNFNSPQRLFGIDDELAALVALDVIVVSAQGNSFWEFNSQQGAGYPAADPNSLSVGATYDSDVGRDNYGGPLANTTGPRRITPFSQRSELLTDVFAPGAYITGANRNGGTVDMPGTSQAAPHIAGIATLMQDLADQLLQRRLTQAEFRDLLRDTAVIINDGDDEDDNVTNTGVDFPMVDVMAMAESLLALVGPPSAVASAPGIFVSGDSEQTVTVTYTDAIGIDTSDIGTGDIRVTGPDGYDELATFVSLTSLGTQNAQVATYTVPAPAGGWTSAVDGLYSIEMQAEEVSDVQEDEFVPAGVIGTFLVEVPVDVGPDGYGYVASATGYSFVDVSGSGTLILKGSDDNASLVTPANGFNFNFYGVDYQSLHVSSNGLLTFGGPNTDYLNTDLSSSPTNAAIAVYWDDLDALSHQGVYWQLLGSGDEQQLVIQWETGYFGGNGDISFQVILSELDNTIRVNYRDLQGGHSSRDNGLSATVGLKDEGFQGDRRLLVHHNGDASGHVGEGRSLVMMRGNLPMEDFGLSADAVTENSPAGTVVGSLSTLDPDFDDSFTYDLVAGSGDWDNGNFEIVGDELRTVVTFDYEQQSAQLIRLRTTDLGGNQLEKEFVINVVDLPELGGIVVGDGTAQRSRIDQLVVTFEGDVEIQDGAFTVTQRESGNVVPVSVTTTVDGQGRAVVALTFEGTLTRGGGALVDGNYQLEIDGSKITRNGQALDADQDGSGGDMVSFGDDEADQFFALYGDSDGNRRVNLADFIAFRSSFGKLSGEDGYNHIFDFDNNLRVNLSDFIAFRARFGTQLDF